MLRWKPLAFTVMLWLPFRPDDSCCKPYVKAFALRPLSECLSMWEDVVAFHLKAGWFRVKAEGCWEYSRGLLSVGSLQCLGPHFDQLMPLSVSKQPSAVVQEWTTCKEWPVTGPGTSILLAGRFSLFINKSLVVQRTGERKWSSPLNLRFFKIFITDLC